MEAATLSSPQRKFNEVPVQKSLSLPSYAKAGGEGIDHRIIFAALEQREKVRRKSKIFTREKTARQNIFCLPIPSGNRCRETSFSSDTSCSSLEYQKPKAVSKQSKKTPETKVSKNEASPKFPDELSIAKTNKPDPVSNSNHHDHNKNVVRTVIVHQKSPVSTLVKGAESFRLNHRSPSNTLRPYVHSSDSMERSSRSSNDSLSRKERLVAIKAKVEAAREKYGDTSSEEDNHGVIPRYGSDGVIHRTVKEVKSRSCRMEKRLRRRSQDEYGIRKAIRKDKNLSLCLNSTEDGIKLDLFSRPLNVFEDQQILECKTDFCPSPNFLDFAKNNYFSDFPSKENMTRMVQARIRQIEEEERKRRNTPDLRDKGRIPSRQSPQLTENSSPFSTQRRNADHYNSTVDKNMSSPDVFKCPSPVGRAPTPPLRSPRSMSFVNKAFIQHQTSYLNQDSRSLERKPSYKPNIPTSKSADVCNRLESPPVDSKVLEDFSEKRKIKELLKARRKTCSYFDYGENFTFKDLKCDVAAASKYNVTGQGTYSSQSSPKSPHAKGFGSGAETPPGLSDDPKKWLWKTKWEETEKKQEFMFNSLESKRREVSPSWLNSSETPQKKDSCLCYVLSGGKIACNCNYNSRNVNSNPPNLCKLGNLSHYANLKDLDPQEAKCRLSKSEMNIAYPEQPKLKMQSRNINDSLTESRSTQTKSSNQLPKSIDHADNLVATANLDIAMEELESIYRSLKFSTETLSEKNSTSNLTLNDLNIETPKNIVNGNYRSDLHFKPVSAKESNLNGYERKSYNIKPVFVNGYEELTKTSVHVPYRDTPTKAAYLQSPDSDNICIDELFNDLTRQLDIEQKLLKDTKDLQSDKREQKRMTPLESIVSIRKELYDNLQKSGQEQVRPYNPATKGRESPQISHAEVAKKKYKAVRSLSENISYLMGSANSSPTSPRKFLPQKTELPSSNSNVETLLIERYSPKHYEHVVLEPPKFQTKKEVSLHQPTVPKRSFISERLKNPTGDEIRQIRVSMDTNVSDVKPVSKPSFSEYPRLSSAVAKQQVSPKNESRPIPLSNSISKEPIDVLDENGLEKLLNTLLNDVPDSRQSSLLSNGNLPSTPPPVATSAGEMRVLQHLDILRLKPIFS